MIGADSHVAQPLGCCSARIDSAFRDRAPLVVRDGVRGDVFVIPGTGRPIAMMLVAAAGKPPEEHTILGVNFEELHRSVCSPIWSPSQRPACAA